MSRLEDKNSRLLDVLLDIGKISNEEVEKIVQLRDKTHEKTDRILLNLGIISEEDLRDALGNIFNLQIWERKKEEELPVVDCLPQSFLHSNRVLPIKQHNGYLDIAITDPSDDSLLEVIESTTNKRVNIFVGCEKDIIASINETYEEQTEEDQSAFSIDLDVVDDIEKLKDLALEAPVVRLVNNTLNKALEIGASDIHIEMFENKPTLRYRIDGVLIDYPPPTRDVYFATINRIKIMSNLNIAEKRLPQDGRIRLKVGGKEIDIRVSVIPMLYGECIVMRILDKSNITLDLSTFGFSKDVLDNLRKLITKSEGMILATGPTGSGKTTTLYASLKEIISPSLKIITVEDPVEYSLEGVNQIQVNTKIGLDFSSGLRSILRHDPDVILVGEIRDKSTAGISIQSSLTGHLVLSTLHTNDAASAFNRLLDMGMEDYLVSTCVIAVLAQRLVRKLCECKEGYSLDKESMARLGLDSDKILYRPNGCIECSNTGYRGRIAISELLIVNDNIREMIVNRERSNVVQQEAMKNGMRTLWQDGLNRVEDGLTSLSELERVTDDTSVKNVTKTKVTNNKPDETDDDSAIETASSNMAVDEDPDDKTDNIEATDKDVIKNSASSHDSDSPETSLEVPSDVCVPIEEAECDETSGVNTTGIDPTRDLGGTDKPILPDETTIHDATTPPDNIVEISLEEPQTEKRSGSGFLKNLQSSVGRLFRSDNQTEAEKADVNDT